MTVTKKQDADLKTPQTLSSTSSGGQPSPEEVSQPTPSPEPPAMEQALDEKDGEKVSEDTSFTRKAP